MSKRVLITGGAGFVGSRLVRACLKEGWEVGITYQPENGLRDIQELVPQVRVYPVLGDPLEAFDIVGNFRPDLVLHLASVFIASHEREDLEILIDSNIAFGAQMLEAMSRHGVPYLVNTGTSWQHASDSPYEPVNLYAATKQAFQDVLEYYIAATSIRAITLKLFDTYGPRDPRTKLFALLERASRENTRLEMSPGEQLIDVVYVDDVVRAFMVAARRLLEGRVGGHEIYAVSSGQPIRLRELVETYRRVSGTPFDAVWGGRPYRPREVMVPWSRGERLPGWQPMVGLEEGIKACLDAPGKPETTPLVSVCIPVYNCRSYIRQAIDSVLCQTFRDFELVILDNASTDGTLEIIAQYTDARIRLIRNRKNLGLEANWNLALQAARGQYVKLLPADDFLYPDCLKQQVEILERPGSERLSLVICARDIVSPMGKRLLSRRFPGGERDIGGRDAIRTVVRSGTNLLGEPGGILFRRALLQKTTRFDGRLAYVIDVRLWLQMLLFGDVHVLNTPLCAFRLSSGSTSLGLATLQGQHFSAFISEISSDPRYGLTWLDHRRGIWMSGLLGLGRKLVYVFSIQTEA